VSLPKTHQLWLASIGTTVPTANVAATALRFFFNVTLKRHDLAQQVVSTREPRRLPVVLSPVNDATSSNNNRPKDLTLVDDTSAFTTHLNLYCNQNPRKTILNFVTETYLDLPDFR